ncbi:hypothetical protein MLD38_027927 [Melastoma candidum]|uniref:Uncharacterized protein n=1 Tax=Melastoma candidum TaxID=119954 RepID=A0ACB9N3Q4_9MYRT|nr:hypothetical protein MLD38_027927 [Melastoma candidum]
MPGIVMDGISEGEVIHGQNGDSAPKNVSEETPGIDKSPKSVVGQPSPQSGVAEVPEGGVVIDTSIEKLYENVYEMQSSDLSPSRQSFETDGEESRIDSELRHLVGGEMREVEIMEDEEEAEMQEHDGHSDTTSKRESSLDSGKKSGKLKKIRSPSIRSVSSEDTKKEAKQKKGSSSMSRLPSKSKSPYDKPPIEKNRDGKIAQMTSPVASSVKKPKSLSSVGSKIQNGTVNPSESKPDDPNLGPFLLKQARDLISSGENPHKALELALRASKSFEACSNGNSSLDLVMSLHVTSAIYSSLGRYNEAIPVLEHSIEIPKIEEGQEHELAKFAGYMQLGDTYAMLGRLESSIKCYTHGLEIQKQALGETDPRVGETCRYLAEGRVQALQFDEAEELCQMALDIHKENGKPASLEEAADRRLMGLICETKGDHEAALEHLVLASMSMVANGQETEVASVDCSIGDTYLSLNRYDEAIFAYQKALTVFKTTKGENHPSAASVFVRLAELHNKTGKFREAKSYCENALRIYEKPLPGIPPEEFASGLTDVSAIYESMNEKEEAIRLLKKALTIYNDAPGHQGTIAGIEAQIGVMQYMLGNYSKSYASLQNAVAKLRASGEKKSAFFGIALNQMGLACIQLNTINEAVGLFEEARDILEEQYGPYHPDTLGVYSNLAGTYDALGRSDDAIKLLEHVVVMREEKLGTANPDVDEEKRRLSELLKESGRVRSRTGRSLENLLGTEPGSVKINGIKV